MSITNTDSLINGNGEPPNYFSLCASLGHLACDGCCHANYAEGGHPWGGTDGTRPPASQVQAEFDTLTGQWMEYKKTIDEAYHGEHISEAECDKLLDGINLIYDAAADRLNAAKVSRR